MGLSEICVGGNNKLVLTLFSLLFKGQNPFSPTLSLSLLPLCFSTAPLLFFCFSPLQTLPPSLPPANCQRLALSDHVLVTSQDTSINTVVSFSCDQGYTLNGDRALACLSTGVWNGTAPSCTAPSASIFFSSYLP